MSSINVGAIQKHAYWLDQLGPAPVLTQSLPDETDVLVIGTGYTGLNAAIVAARGGCKVVAIDAADPGFGCSTRNGGQISTSVKPSQPALAARFGDEKARAIRAEGQASLDWIKGFVASEALDCDFRQVGRFHAAHTPAHYDTLQRDAEALHKLEGIDSFAVTRADQHAELGTDTYHGGVVFPAHCSVHPARYHRELLRLALSAGAQITGHCAATQITRTAQGFTVQTEKGPIRTREVMLATNGYGGGLVPWLQRRIIPIGSYIIATEELPPELVDELFPTDRIASDTCKVIYYYRASPDRRRILFGGRVSAHETSAEQAAPRLYQAMCRIFPQLRAYGISHAWSGTVAYTFDELAQTGVQDGIHFAQGYCGSGVAMAGYLGMRAGQKLLGLAEGRTAFDDLPKPTRPFYTGKPWFLPAAVAWYRWIDNLECRRAARAA